MLKVKQLLLWLAELRANQHETSSVKQTASLKEIVLDIEKKSEPNGLTLMQLIDLFQDRSHPLIILFLSLPFIQPLPLFGLSAILGGVIFLSGLLMIFQVKPWLPGKFQQKMIQKSLVKSCTSTLIKVLNRTEKCIKPRFIFLSTSLPAKIFNGLLVMLFAFLLALPLPIPFTNSVPAYFLIMNAVGCLEEDGLLIGLSYLVAIAGVIFFMTLGVGAAEIMQMLLVKVQKYI